MSVFLSFVHPLFCVLIPLNISFNNDDIKSFNFMQYIYIYIYKVYN